MIIGKKEIGNGKPTCIIIELGVTHEKDLELAKKMIGEAKAAGADLVKCECIRPDSLVAEKYRDTLIYEFVPFSGRRVRMRYYDLLREVAFTFEEIEELKKYSDSLCLPFFGTAFDIESVDFLNGIGACAIKISSGEITHLPLIIYAAENTQLPIIMDTGNAKISEISMALETAYEYGAKNLALMHNPSGYPSPYDQLNLKRIVKLKQLFDVPVGYSCHVRGNTAVCAAVGIGANLIEKPVSRDNTQDGDEHIFSLNIDEMKAFVETIKNLDDALLHETKKPGMGHISERERIKFRQSIIIKKACQAGERLSMENLGFARPGWGIPTHFYDRIIGTIVRKNIEAGRILEWDDLLENYNPHSPA